MMIRLYVAAALAALLAGSTASPSLVARQTSGAAVTPDPTAVSQCSVRSSTQVCSAGTAEFMVVAMPTGSLPNSYTGCHKHSSELWCNYSGGEVQIMAATAAAATTATLTVASNSRASATVPPTAVSECHKHGSDVLCMWGTTEYQVIREATATQEPPAAYTGCHAHGSDTFCVAPDGSEVEIRAEGDNAAGDHDDHNHGGDAGGSNQHCHFHAGVEHCVGGGAQEATCERVTRDYNIPLRVGLLFVILATSSIGVFTPIFLIRWWPAHTHKAFLILKQFGTGVIISTAFIHLYTHAQLMFANECLGELEFEGVTAAIVMAGIFLSFLVEYVGKRIVLARAARAPERPSRLSPQTVTVLVLECGIIFHSILIGITLVVAGDSFFLTLFVVILFHQMFEGIALGSRIAALGAPKAVDGTKLVDPAATAALPPSPSEKQNGDAAADGSDSSTSDGPTTRPAIGAAPLPAGSSLMVPQFSLAKKLLLASPFALVTPVGMAIGIGVLRHFNGNNRDTILAIGTLDALSAGILVWVGVVEMWAEDWMVAGAELLQTGVITTLLAFFGLIGGMVIMSVLGKWA